jgi:DNA-binding IclR family transcriptional regulator
MLKRPSPYPGTQAVVRAITLLKAFSDTRSELGLSELARSAGLNKSTAYRLLSALESEGLITKVYEGETYRLGPEAIALGARAVRANGLVTVSRPELEWLAEETGETASIEVIRGSDALILDEVAGQHMLGSVPSIGMRWPVHVTSTGKVILAYLSPVERKAILPRRLVPLTDYTIIDLATFEEDLAQVRRQGYAVGRDELEVGFVAIAAPVFDHRGHVDAAVSIGGPSIRFTPDRMAALSAAVKQAGERVSRKLGYTARFDLPQS